ncbi:MAG TPA: efflux RND transporter periplasmic adaptor subunit [Thermoanaerobaculia bacterium]|nr:efflux RND transporter periplasmic adaptor subunit [Thermoanaerobaculia bacterium]
MRKSLIGAGIAIAAVLAGAGWTRNKLAADRQGDWVRVSRGDLVTGIDVTGTLSAVDSGSFGPPPVNDVWEYKISMIAPEGSDVKVGAPVLGFDTTDLQKRLDEKSAERDQAHKEIEKNTADLALRREDEKLKLADAEARLRKAQLKLEGPPDIVSSNDRRQIELDFALAKQETESIRQRIASFERAAAAQIALLTSKQLTAASVVNETQNAIKAMSIAAPRNGTIVYVVNWRGDKKKVGDTCWRMERVIEIPDLARMMAKGEVDEADAGKIAVGQRVVFNLDAHPDEEFAGTIKEAGRTVQQQQGTKDPIKVLKVNIVLDRTDPAKMRPGMRFHGTVELARAKSALLIPRSAVFVTDSGPVAYRRGAFSVTAVPLKLGRENEKTVEVVSGLSASDRVLVPKAADGKEPQKS